MEKTEKLLPDSLRQQVQELLGALQHPVEVVVFKSGLLEVPGAGEVGLQNETLALLREVAELSDKIRIEERSLLTDPEAQRLGLSYAPTLLFREAGSERGNIRFLGIPSGYEFTTLLETLIMLGSGQSDLGERSRESLATLQTPVRMQAFVTPTCPYCPKAVLTAFKFAYHNPQVVAEGIEASEFPKLSRHFNISGVPDTIITGARQERVLGGQPDRVFLEAVLKAGGVSLAGGAQR
ncbi:protein disulfide oxidoreductase [Meiothermus granaticius]|uniref:Alkyl hydroperoxide reductase subunit F n=1 Tax=Meiothermus granaticius NBRC 107808 TaxID=1227551 RepID=A0A399F6Z9_9DEIN|nr:thioredoxin family protein [Meiothermus granaticius]RIH91515.1 Alkyl hydroperoxide reductase subunit F [Meiothermus granaticius NBRC 107808]GEM88248.1 glutaredoxin [Meiothermus granaticius NBRC 107808]